MKIFKCWASALYTDEAAKRVRLTPRHILDGKTVDDLTDDEKRCEHIVVEVEQPDWVKTSNKDAMDIVKLEAIRKVLQIVEIDNDCNVFRVYQEGTVKIKRIEDEEEKEKETQDFFKSIGIV